MSDWRDHARGDHATGTAVELSADECRELLATQQVGRVAYVTPQGPRIVPVNFVLREGRIELRTTSYSELATYAPGEAVAFEVDVLDREHEAGWSVIVTGRCERALEEFGAVFSSPGESSATPWAGGRRPMVLRIEPTAVSGRRVGEAQWHHPDAAR